MEHSPVMLKLSYVLGQDAVSGSHLPCLLPPLVSSDFIYSLVSLSEIIWEKGAYCMYVMLVWSVEFLTIHFTRTITLRKEGCAFCLTHIYSHTTTTTTKSNTNLSLSPAALAFRTVFFSFVRGRRAHNQTTRKKTKGDFQANIIFWFSFWLKNSLRLESSSHSFGRHHRAFSSSDLDFFHQPSIQARTTIFPRFFCSPPTTPTQRKERTKLLSPCPVSSPHRKIEPAD